MFPQFGRKKGSLVGAESNIKVMRDSLIVFVVQTPERLMCLWKLPGAGFVQHKHSSGETILVEGTMTFTLVRFGSQQMSRLFASQTSELSSDACLVFSLTKVIRAKLCWIQFYLTETCILWLKTCSECQRDFSFNKFIFPEFTREKSFWCKNSLQKWVQKKFHHVFNPLTSLTRLLF